MKKSRLIGALSAVVFTVISMSSHAALEGRDLDGNLTTAEAYYDDVAGLTWLADADAAVGSAYDTYSPGTGLMNWDDANAWAAGLDIDGITGPDGWRLPTTLQPDSSCGIQSFGYSSGFNCTGSEMGNLFYNVLGGVAGSSITTTHNSNYDLFSNVQSGAYWSATELSNPTTNALFFNFGVGEQNNENKGITFYAWAVHDGDVGTPTLIGVLPSTPGGTDYQAYYDPAADLSWLANANAGAGSAYDDGSSTTDGLMTWDNANAWAANLDINGVTGWRLPTTLQPDSSCSNQDGVDSYGFNCTGSEMGNLFYNVLGNTSGSGVKDTGPFSNVQSDFYWSSTEYATLPGFAWRFYFSVGLQEATIKTGFGYAWAVQSGDVGLDSDSDGLPDYIEDSNHNGVVDPGETNPLDPDSDNDGALDGQEDSNHNGVVDAGEADPLNPDSDGDGLTDGYEINVGGTDPSTATTLYTLQCDMNYDDEVNVGDLLLLQRQILGL